MEQIKLDNLQKEYDDVVAVDDMNLSLEDGEFVSFVGPSGCGKTTTLEMIAGLTNPTRGTIEIGGRDVTNVPPKNREIAMVFQNIALFPHIDVRDNISFGLRMRGYDADVLEERVHEAVEILELEGMLDRMPDELSGGQQQRVAIGRALVREPEVFLMDEPLANLDAKLRVHMRTEIQRIQRKLDVTTVYVTHDQEEAMTMSDRIVVMDQGEVQQFAPPLECYNEPENTFVASFIGSPSMNFLGGVVTDDGVETPHFDVTLEFDGLDVHRDQSVTIGIRPEDLYPADAVDTPAQYTDPITVTVDVTEPTGQRILAYLVARSNESASVREDDELLMSVDPDFDVDEGDTIDVLLDRSKIHLFDETGEAIMHGAPSDVPANDASNLSSQADH